MSLHLIWNRLEEEFEDTKEVIRIRKSKDRQHNGQKRTKRQKRFTKYTHKIKDKVTRTPLKTVFIITGGYLLYAQCIQIFTKFQRPALNT